MSPPTSLILVKAGTLVDGENIDCSPGAVLLERDSDKEDKVHVPVGWKILAAGPLREVESHPLTPRAHIIDRLNSVVCPALVNAHTHLDLTHIGPWGMPESGGFEHFVSKVRAERKTDPAHIRASVRLGIEASRRGGVVAVGDISGAAGGVPQTAPFLEMKLNRFLGTSYIEFFALGNGETRGIEHIRAAIAQSLAQSSPLCKIGIHPHAPYSVSLNGYRAAIQMHREQGLPICSHVAESLAEREFVTNGTGPLRNFLESIGIWNGLPEGIGLGKTPAAHIAGLNQAEAIRLVHLNDLSDSDLAAISPNSIAIYCPRSSQYFRAELAFGPHRYRELISRGIKVALGTDSLMNLLDQPAQSPRISTWDEMKLLYHRDGTDPRLLLTMATTWGAEAIQIPAEHFQLAPDLSVIDLIGIMMEGERCDLATALQSQACPELLLNSK